LTSTDHPAYTQPPFAEAAVLPHDLFSQYLTHIQHRRAPLTHVAYTADLKAFQKFLAASGLTARKREISPRLLDHYLAWLKGRRFADWTIQRRLQGLKSFFRWAVKRRYLRDDPFLVWELPTVAQDLPRPLTPEEDLRLLALLERPASTQYRRTVLMAVRLARFAGLRRGECNALTWANVDLGKGLLIVRKGKGGKDRAVPIPDGGLRRPLLAWWEAAGRPEDGCVLSGLRHRPLPAKALSQSIRHVYRAAQVAGATFHTLRTTYATRLLELGATIREVQDLLGHASVQTTMRYAAVTDLRKRDAVSRLDRDLQG
jgi:integrase/recombinase XerD